MPDSHPLRFDERVVLITGAAIGLGRAYAHAFAEKGAHVIVNDRPPAPGSSNGAQELADAVTRKGHSAFAVSCSVLEADELMRQVLSRHGRIDVIVNNAGFLRDAAFHKMTSAQWEAICDVHLTGTFRVTRAAWPHLRSANFGRIIMTSSCAGLFGNFGQANYAAAKMGLLGLAQTLAIEGARHNVRVNVIAPLATSRLTEGVLPPALLARLQPEQIAPVVLALSHESCTRTGQIFEVGGGYAWRLRWQLSEMLDLGVDTPLQSDVLDEFKELGDLAGVADSMGRIARRLGVENAP